jgi:small subunit ribosomal protein S16
LAVRIRLKRYGTTNRPAYRIVVAERSAKRDGEVIDQIGHYDPRTDPSTMKVDAEAARRWMERGALPSVTVRNIFKKLGII